MRWRDRLIGIALGTALGVGVVTAFVFLYSDQTVDAPSLSQGAVRDPVQRGSRIHRPSQR